MLYKNNKTREIFDAILFIGENATQVISFVGGELESYENGCIFLRSAGRVRCIRQGEWVVKDKNDILILLPEDFAAEYTIVPVYRIAHWTQNHSEPPVPEAVEIPVKEGPFRWQIQIDDLREFVAKHGKPIQVRPPHRAPPAAEGNWLIWITDRGFGQS